MPKEIKWPEAVAPILSNSVRGISTLFPPKILIEGFCTANLAIMKNASRAVETQSSDECKLRHPFLANCKTSAQCQKICINLDLLDAMPQLQNKTTLVASLEFWFCILDISFLSASELCVSGDNNGGGGEQMRIISGLYRFYWPDDPACAMLTRDINYEYDKGRDITYDFMKLITKFCRETYSNAKDVAAKAANKRNTLPKQPLRRGFLDTDIFRYLVTLEASVDSLYQNVLYTELSEASFENMSAENRLPSHIITKYSLQSLNAKGDIQELDQLDERTNMLNAARNRLTILKRHCENSHLAYLMLVRKYVCGFAADERNRLKQIFMLSEEERQIYQTGDLGQHETPTMKAQRLSLANLHQSMRIESHYRFQMMLTTLLNRLFSEYLDFCAISRGIPLEIRVKNILKYDETVSEDFVDYRRAQFTNVRSYSTSWIMPYELQTYSYPWQHFRRTRLDDWGRPSILKTTSDQVNEKSTIIVNNKFKPVTRTSAQYINSGERQKKCHTALESLQEKKYRGECGKHISPSGVSSTTRNLYVVETSDSAATPHFSLQNRHTTDFGQSIILPPLSSVMPSSSSSNNQQELAMMSVSSSSSAAPVSTPVEKGDMSFCVSGGAADGAYMDYLQSPMMPSFGSAQQPAATPSQQHQEDSNKTDSHSFNVSASPFFPALMTSPPLEFIDNIVLCDTPSTTDDFDMLFSKYSTETLTTNNNNTAETSTAVATRSSVRESSGSFTRSQRRYR